MYHCCNHVPLRTLLIVAVIAVPQVAKLRDVVLPNPSCQSLAPSVWDIALASTNE